MFAMLLSDFDYDLPQECIAQHPLPERDASRMLALDRRSGTWEDAAFRDFPARLHGDELVVVNNTRVIPARLFGKRAGIHSQKPGKNNPALHEFLTADVEVLLTRELGDNEWEALVRPGRKIPCGEQILFGGGELKAEVIGRSEYGMRRLRLNANGNVHSAIERLGHVPLPPYIRRSDEAADRERYQTVFATRPGAVAAPTAGLHFTPAILEQMRVRGIEFAEITLNVGLGTFQPIHEEQIENHKMHLETYEIPEAAASAVCKARREGRPIVAIGTTVVRALEDAALKAQTKHRARLATADHAPLVESGSAEAGIFIKPGHSFLAVDQLLTNFHLPRSSLLVLVSAFAGREFILGAYRHAVDAGYRFYSYGDSMWIR